MLQLDLEEHRLSQPTIPAQLGCRAIRPQEGQVATHALVGEGRILLLALAAAATT